MKKLSTLSFLRFAISTSFRISCIFLLLSVSQRSNAQISFSSTTVPTGAEFTPAGGGLVQTPDINGDGLADIIYTTAVGGAITYLQNNGDGTFSTPATNPFASYTSSSPTGTVFNASGSIADFDGDGDVDIWVRVNGAANDVYLRNDAGTFVTGTVISGMEYTSPSTTNVQVNDINNDGYVDIIYCLTTGGAITYLQNNGGTSFSIPSTNPFASYTSSSPTGFSLVGGSADVADFDGDGDLDIWTRVTGAGNDVYLRNDAGTYVTGAVPSGLEFAAASGTGVVRVGDFNGDGLPDALYNLTSGGGLTYLQNNGGSFSTPTPNPFASFTSSTATGVLTNLAASVLDMDGDGDLDFWVRVGGAGNDFYLAASGAAPRITSTSPTHLATSVAVGSNIVLNFSENVFTGAGSFFIRNLSDNSIVETIAANGPRVTGSGTSSITIDPVADLTSGTSYYVTFNRRALADADGVIAGHVDVAMRVRVPETTSDFLTFSTPGTLPVTWVRFDADAVNNKVVLEWETATEENARDFNIQTSTDGQNWTGIGTVAAVGNSNSNHVYRFVHDSPANGVNQYRLLQSDIDGRTHLSVVRIVKLTLANAMRVYPNPASGGRLLLQFTSDEKREIVVFNINGSRVYQGIYSGSRADIQWPNATAGVYTVLVTSPGGKLTETILVK